MPVGLGAKMHVHHHEKKKKKKKKKKKREKNSMFFDILHTPTITTKTNKIQREIAGVQMGSHFDA
jgi:predicted transcriptional regulator